MTSSLFVIVTTFFAGVVIGLIPTLIDAVKTLVAARFKDTAIRTDWFVPLFYLTWLPAMPGAGLLLDNTHSKEILFFGLVALVLGVAWLALINSLASLLVNAIFLGTAYSTVAVAGIRLMTSAFFPDYVETDKMNIASLNLGFVMVAFGALLGPGTVKAIERWSGYRQGLLYVSAALILPAALTALCDRSRFPSAPENAAPWHELYLHPHLMLIAGVILLYFILENLLEYWPEAFLKDIEYQGGRLKLTLLVFWLAFIGTRAAAAWWVYHHPGHGFAITILLIIASGCVLGNLAGGFDVGSSTFGFWLAGACYGPILPGLLGIALDFYHPLPLPVSALGVILALSGLDTLVVRPLVSASAEARSARSLMRVPTFLAFALAAPLLLLAFFRS